jgi:lactoylglutathione lyase
MRFLHTMVRVTDLDASLHFYCELLGLEVLNRFDIEAGRFTLVFLAAPGNEVAQVKAVATSVTSLTKSRTSTDSASA